MMLAFWLKFQGMAGESFAKVMSVLPGSDLLQLLVSSALIGILMVWLYSLVSFQKSLAALKRRISTVVFEPFLFSDSARISLLAPLRLIGLACRYMALSVPPLLILAGPVVWMLGLWNQVVGYDDIKPGEQVVVSIIAENPKNIRQLQVSLEGEGFSISPLVRSFHDAKAWTGLQASESQPKGALLVKTGDSTVRIPLSGTPALALLTESPWKRFLFPGSKVALPDGIEEIAIDLPARHFEILGTKVSWAVLFLIVSMISGLVFAKKFKIQV